MLTKGKFYTALLLLSIASFVVWAIVRIAAACDLDAEVGGHLQNYVEAGTIEIAEEELEQAILALEAKGLTEGLVSIFWRNANNDIGIWYNNLSKSKSFLTSLSKETPINQSISLEKQRNGLVGGVENTYIKHPNGISIYPYNKAFFWWCILSIVGIVIFGIICLAVSEENEWNETLIKVKDCTAKA